NSARKDGPIHCLNCGALPENLVESELFGHEKGAFTGAIAQKKGAFELATGGTIFLDEVGEMDGKSQAKLLRVLEERVVRRVGGTEDIRVDVRIIAATNKDLAKEVPAGRFREDLLYRLRVIEIRLPALRERRDDVGMLTDFYLAKFREEMGRKVEGISDAARKALEAHAWPGNVRELRNCLERAVLLASGTLIEAADLGLKAASPQADTEAFPTLKELEKRHLQAAIERAGGNKTEAAALLGIMRSTLYEKLKELGWPRPNSQ
ncbi:MAG: sigma-54 dependent transcriptional regulator, partial [Planctomycetota bacterium]